MLVFGFFFWRESYEARQKRLATRSSGSQPPPFFFDFFLCGRRPTLSWQPVFVCLQKSRDRRLLGTSFGDENTMSGWRAWFEWLLHCHSDLGISVFWVPPYPDP